MLVRLIYELIGDASDRKILFCANFEWGNFQSYSILARPGRLINKDEVFTQTESGLNVTAMNKHRSVLISIFISDRDYAAKSLFEFLIRTFWSVRAGCSLRDHQRPKSPHGDSVAAASSGEIYLCAILLCLSACLVLPKTSKIASSEFTRKADKILLLSPCSLFPPPGNRISII